MKRQQSCRATNILTSGWVLEVGWKVYSLQDSSQEDVILIMGRVRHSYSLSKPPLQPWVVVKQSGAVMVAHCISTVSILMLNMFCLCGMIHYDLLSFFLLDCNYMYASYACIMYNILCTYLQQNVDYICMRKQD